VHSEAAGGREVEEGWQGRLVFGVGEVKGGGCLG